MEMRRVALYGLTATATRVLRCIEDVSNDEARRTPNDLSPLIWQLGHLAQSDGGFLQRGGMVSPAPASFSALFKTGSGGPAAYPSLVDVKATFEAAQRELEKLAGTADLTQRVDARNYATLGEMLVFAAYHRGYHVGKMTTLRALLGKPRLFG